MGSSDNGFLTCEWRAVGAPPRHAHSSIKPLKGGELHPREPIGESHVARDLSPETFEATGLPRRTSGCPKVRSPRPLHRRQLCRPPLPAGHFLGGVRVAIDRFALAVHVSHFEGSSGIQAYTSKWSHVGNEEVTVVHHRDTDLKYLPRDLVGFNYICCRKAIEREDPLEAVGLADLFLAITNLVALSGSKDFRPSQVDKIIGSVKFASPAQCVSMQGRFVVDSGSAGTRRGTGTRRSLKADSRRTLLVGTSPGVGASPRRPTPPLIAAPSRSPVSPS